MIVIYPLRRTRRSRRITSFTAEAAKDAEVCGGPRPVIPSESEGSEKDFSLRSK